MSEDNLSRAPWGSCASVLSLRLSVYPVRGTYPISFSVRKLPVSVDFNLNRGFSKVTLHSTLITDPPFIDGKSSQFSLTALLPNKPHRC